MRVFTLLTAWDTPAITNVNKYFDKYTNKLIVHNKYETSVSKIK